MDVVLKWEKFCLLAAGPRGDLDLGTSLSIVHLCFVASPSFLATHSPVPNSSTRHLKLFLPRFEFPVRGHRQRVSINHARVPCSEHLASHDRTPLESNWNAGEERNARS